VPAANTTIDETISSSSNTPEVGLEETLGHATGGQERVQLVVFFNDREKFARSSPMSVGNKALLLMHVKLPVPQINQVCSHQCW